MRDIMLDSVISTRVRLARNLEGVRFPRKMSESEAMYVIDAVISALGAEYKLYDKTSLGEGEIGTLIERHLISKELPDKPYGAVAIHDDETLSVMINEEDHVRIQAILGGLRLREALALAGCADEAIGENACYAKTKELGYLTACPTNTGTGLRVSVMLFLPALTAFGDVRSALPDITIRGVYGEGSRAEGSVYQISNTYTLGVSVADALALVREQTLKLLEREDEARQKLLRKRGAALEDEIMRAYGVARYARIITNDELLSIASKLKLGAYYGILRIKSVEALDETVTALAPFSLRETLALGGNPDEARAAAVRRFVINNVK